MAIDEFHLNSKPHQNAHNHELKLPFSEWFVKINIILIYEI